MSGGMRRIGEYLGLLEDTGRYDDEYDDDYADPDGGYEPRERRYAGEETGPVAVAEPTRREPREARRPATVADLDERRAARAARSPRGPAVAELSRITTLHPRTYNEARTVCENFRDGTPVIMNLSEMDDSDAKRLVDFAGGWSSRRAAGIERITSKVFLLSPPNVTVATEDKVSASSRVASSTRADPASGPAL